MGRRVRRGEERRGEEWREEEGRGEERRGDLVFRGFIPLVVLVLHHFARSRSSSKHLLTEDFVLKRKVSYKHRREKKKTR